MSLSSMRVVARSTRHAGWVRSVATTPRVPTEELVMQTTGLERTDAQEDDMEFQYRPDLEADRGDIAPQATPGCDPTVNWSLASMGISPAAECWRNMSWEVFSGRTSGKIEGGAAIVEKAAGQEAHMFLVGDEAAGAFAALPEFAYDDFAVEVTTALSYAPDGLFVVDGAVGSSRAADRRVRFVTDDPDTARAVQHLLHPIEKSFPKDGPYHLTIAATRRAVPHSPGAPDAPVAVLSVDDDVAFGVLSQVADPTAVQRLVLQALSQLRGVEMAEPELNTGLMAKVDGTADDPLSQSVSRDELREKMKEHALRLHRARDQDALVMRCDAYVGEDGASKLVFGAPSVDASAALYGSGASWTSSGLAAVFGGVALPGAAPQAGDVVINGTAFRHRRVVNAAPAPARAIFADPSAKAPSTVSPADVQALVEEHYTVAAAGSEAAKAEAAALVERLQAAGTEVVVAPPQSALTA